MCVTPSWPAPLPPLPPPRGAVVWWLDVLTRPGRFTRLTAVRVRSALQWFAKARRQAQLALSRAKSAKYDPFEDPKYAPAGDDEDDDDDDDDEDEE